MSPRRVVRTVHREVPLLQEEACLRDAVPDIIRADVPALPVIDRKSRLRGIFGEREFIGAMFPGYLKTLGYAKFVPSSLDDALEKRPGCGDEPVGKHMNTEHIDVGEDASDTELAEIFLHHRVLIVPIVDAGRVTGIVTREDFFREIAQRLLSP